MPPSPELVQDRTDPFASRPASLQPAFPAAETLSQKEPALVTVQLQGQPGRGPGDTPAAPPRPWESSPGGTPQGSRQGWARPRRFWPLRISSSHLELRFPGGEASLSLHPGFWVTLLPPPSSPGLTPSPTFAICINFYSDFLLILLFPFYLLLLFTYTPSPSPTPTPTPVPLSLPQF